MTTSADTLQLTEIPVTDVGMLIRRPVQEVFEAFVDPATTTKFWFTHGSGRLEAGARVEWRWEMYDVSTTIQVKEVEQGERILIEWEGYSGPTTVEWRFASRADGTTFVSITEEGFRGTGDEVAHQATSSTQGFTFVLAGLKAWLEHGIELNLVADRFPPEVDEA
jgi:uncharacterized protein YndB with AHSA1/START domain